MKIPEQYSEYITKGAGTFLYMVSEAILGKTKYGSWLGLAKAIVWFSIRAIVDGIWGLLLRFFPPNNKEK